MTGGAGPHGARKRIRRAVVGTAGHIDHGKTALVRALTGTDTDRLPEEKARGITIDLGFAELPADDDLQTGVVDVPGHEDFIRAMVAGATGVDAVLLVVAADEGVMPQTTEHLDIVRLLRVPALVVALTKADLVEAEWLALVEEDVRTLLADTPYREAPLVPTSVVDGSGVQAVRDALGAAARRANARDDDDLVRLPVDRVFTLQGTGTVVTGTLWSGTLHQGDRVRLLPDGPEARIRSLQVHGRHLDEAHAGERTAVALASTGRHDVARGSTLVTSGAWAASRMITVEIRMLERSPWALRHGQRVRVHVGTAEVLARCALLDAGALDAGARGWVQLRLEQAMVVRAGDALVLRSYSPVTTLGGGTVAESDAPKRRRLGEGDADALAALARGDAAARVRAALALAGWKGVPTPRLPVVAGVAPGVVAAILEGLAGEGGAVARGQAFGRDIVVQAERRVLAALRQGHAEEPLRRAVSLERLRNAVAPWAPAALADATLERLRASGRLDLHEGGAREPGFEPAPTPAQATACEALEAVYRNGGAAPPFLDDLPTGLRERPDLRELLQYLEAAGILRTVDLGLFYAADALGEIEASILAALEGRTDLGPADFRDVLPVSRRHLMPLLSWLDGEGVTVRRGPVRDVPARGNPVVSRGVYDTGGSDLKP